MKTTMRNNLKLSESLKLTTRKQDILMRLRRKENTFILLVKMHSVAIPENSSKS